MLCGAGKNGYLFQVGAETQAVAERPSGGRPLVMCGRPMRGFFWVDPAAIEGKALNRWLALAEAHVGMMPAKTGRKAKRQ